MKSEPKPPGGAPGPEELALAYAEQCSEGPPPPLEELLARLATQAERDEFLALVEAMQAAERALPRPPHPIASEQLVAGRYQLVRRLGAGGMGQVWEARDRQLDRRVAIKFLDSASQGLVEREELFRKESQLLASLQHPGIVAVHEYGRDGGLTYIVMDLVEGRALSDVLESVRSEFVQRGAPLRPREAALLGNALDRPLPQGRTSLVGEGDWFRCVARIALELARIVEAAHGQRVVHRDLKPSNVMLTGGGNPVVLDFGLAGSFERAHGLVTQGLYGSMAYLAPEQARSRAVGLDPRTDVYQLGLILYELLTLQRTFPGEAIGDVLERIQLGRFPAPRSVRPDVPRELEAICLCALELDPARRYPGARELAADLERCVSGRELPHALGAGNLLRSLRRVRWHVRQRPWLSGFAGLVLASLAFTAWMAAQSAPKAVIRPLSVTRLHEGVREPLRDADLVAPDDIIAFRLQTSTPVHVWALSVFGADLSKLENCRVSPYRATTPADPRRLHASTGPWELRLDAGENDVLGTQITQKPSPDEGLLLLASEKPQPVLEQWFVELDLADRGMGVPWRSACDQGAAILIRSRGSNREWEGRTFTAEEVDGIIRGFQEAPGPSAENEKWIDLPDIEQFHIQCRSR